MPHSSNIYLLVYDLIDLKASRYFTKAKQISASAIAWPLYDGNFLYIDPVYQVVRVVDPQMNVLFEASDADLWIVSRAMYDFADTCSIRNKQTFSERLNHFFTRIAYFVRNLNPYSDTRYYMGRFSEEEDYTRSWTLSYLLTRALELGAEKLKLENTKIVDKFIFFPRKDDYLVLTPIEGDSGFHCYYAEEPTLESLGEPSGIMVTNEDDIIKNLQVWIAEAEAGSAS